MKAERITARPHYIRIADALRDRIRDGTYPLDSLLPTEGELCEEFSISRHTAREALRVLTKDGLIQRRQGSGSRVIATEIHQNYVHSMRSLDQLFQYASDTRFKIESIGLEIPNPSTFASIEHGSDRPWLTVRGLRLEADEDIPICHSIVLINDRFADIADELKTGGEAIYRRIENRFGVEVTEVVQDIVVVPMPASSAHALEKKLPALAVQVSRRYVDAAQNVLLSSVNYHPTESFFYSMRLRRETPSNFTSP